MNVEIGTVAAQFFVSNFRYCVFAVSGDSVLYMCNLCAGVAEHGSLLRPVQPHQAVERLQALGGQDHGGVLQTGRQGQPYFLKGKVIYNNIFSS